MSVASSRGIFRNDATVTLAPYLLAVTRPTCHRCGEELDEPLATTCDPCREELRQEIARYAEFLRASGATETALALVTGTQHSIGHLHTRAEPSKERRMATEKQSSAQKGTVHVVHISTNITTGCEHCTERIGGERFPESVNHYAEQHGYSLVHVGTETSRDTEGDLQHHTVAVLRRDVPRSAGTATVHRVNV
jgi:hypothetical protein